MYLYFQSFSEEWFINSMIFWLVNCNILSSLQTLKSLDNKEQASSNLCSGINSSEMKEVTLGYNQSLSIVCSNSIAYLNKLWTKIDNFPSSIILGYFSNIDIIISKPISLIFSSKSFSSIILPIKI